MIYKTSPVLYTERTSHTCRCIRSGISSVLCPYIAIWMWQLVAASSSETKQQTAAAAYRNTGSFFIFKVLLLLLPFYTLYLDGNLVKVLFFQMDWRQELLQCGSVAADDVCADEVTPTNKLIRFKLLPPLPPPQNAFFFI